MPYKNKEDERKNKQKYYREHRKEILDRQKQYYKDNPEKVLEQNKLWKENNPEKIKRQHKKDYIKNKDSYLRRARKWQRENPEKYKEQHKKHSLKFFRTEKGRACRQRTNTMRRVRMKKIVNTLTAQEWLDILEKYNYKCAYCDTEFEVENMPTRDHVIPISRGGNNTKENIVPACKSCNREKYNKILTEEVFCAS